MFLWFQLLLICVFQSYCLWFIIAGSGLYLFLILPLGMYRLSAVTNRFVNSCVSLWMLLILGKLGKLGKFSM